MKLGIIEPKVKNIRFKKRFAQEQDIVLADQKFQSEIKKVRMLWKIPKHGFNEKTYNKFIKWLYKQRHNDFKNISSSLKGFKLIKSSPRYFLNNVLFSHENINNEYPDSLYFLSNAETFYNITNEKPFPGIVHYILFNDIFIPESNQLQFSFDKYGYVKLRIGPNATMDDIREFLRMIKGFQSKMIGYKKNKTRFKKNLKKDLYLIEYDKETEKLIKQDNLKGKEAMLFRETRSYEKLDNNYPNKNNSSKIDKMHLADLRKRKNRTIKNIKLAVHD